MESNVFDRIARQVGGTPTRRQAVSVATAGVLLPLLALLGLARPVAAGCGCPKKRPCCIKGKCKKKCGNKCCKNCFIQVHGLTGEKIPGSKFCCEGNKGTVCRYKKKTKKDDRCCWPDERCVNNRCCGDFALGARRCGGKCCPIASCCNGACCPKGEVCATPEAGGGKTCVSANRDCTVDGDCHPGETCHGGMCCSGDRICESGADAVCCPAGEYCDTSSGSDGICCPFNTVCNTYRNHRVRP